MASNINKLSKRYINLIIIVCLISSLIFIIVITTLSIRYINQKNIKIKNTHMSIVNPVYTGNMDEFEQNPSLYQDVTHDTTYQDVNTNYNNEYLEVVRDEDLQDDFI